MLIRTKGDNKLFQVLQVGPWQGLTEVNVQELENPLNRWVGGKRTLAQHQQALAFLDWTYKETKSEAMVHWFYHEGTLAWQPVVLPQRGVGMTVKVLEDHAQYVPTFERLGAGWEIMGTDHHHCSASAFQSGTDHADEKGKEGLHLTIGGLGSEKYSLHARSSFRQTIRPVLLTDWYHLPDAFQLLPLDLQEKAMQHLLCLPANVEFPEWWKENVIRYDASRTVVVYDTKSKSSQWAGYDNRGGTYISRRLKHELEDFRKTFKMDIWSFYDWLARLQDNEHLMALQKHLSFCYSDIDDAVECIEEELKENNYELEDEDIVVDAKGDPLVDADGDFVRKEDTELERHHQQLVQDIADSDERVTGWYGD
jgi:hypothetical protein